MGLVNKVVEDSELERTTREIALKLARGATLSYAMVKENLNEAQLGLLERMLEVERKTIIRAGKTKDGKEGIEAFIAKRQPDYKGQ